MVIAYLDSSHDLEVGHGKEALVSGEIISKPRPIAGLSRCFCCCRRWRTPFSALSARRLDRAKLAKFWKPGKPKQQLPEENSCSDGYAALETPIATPRHTAPKSAGAVCTELAACACGAGHEGNVDDDFYDAQSEADDDEPDLAAGWSPSLPSCVNADGNSTYTPTRVAEVHRHLRTLLNIEQQCQGQCASGPLGKLDSEQVLHEPEAQLWLCSSQGNPFVIGCLRCILAGADVRDAVEAIQNPSERMVWDGDSFSSFQVLREHSVGDPIREDAVFTVLPLPRPVRHREILQRRWQASIGDGAQALLMQSFEDDKLQPPDPGRVRAFTHLSGYLLRPLSGSGAMSRMEVVVISQCDLGGAMPTWFQNMARRLAKRRCQAWGQKLAAHCQVLAQQRRAKPCARGETSSVGLS